MIDDSKRALAIYGQDIATLKGKTTKLQNSSIPNFQPIEIPTPIIAKYRAIKLFTSRPRGFSALDLGDGAPTSIE